MNKHINLKANSNNPSDKDKTVKSAENITYKPAENKTGKPSENKTVGPAEDKTGRSAENKTGKPAEGKNMKSTEDLMKSLSGIDNTSQLKLFRKELENSSHITTFHEYICMLASDQNISKAKLINDSGINRNYGYQLLDGQRAAGRDKVIALCASAHCDLDQTQKALTLAKHNKLYPKFPRDSALIYSFHKGLTVIEINMLLDEMGFEILD